MPRLLSAEETLNIHQQVCKLRELAIDALSNAENKLQEYQLQEALLIDIVYITFEIEREDHSISYLEHKLYDNPQV